MKKRKVALYLILLSGFFLVNCLNPMTDIWLEEPVSGEQEKQEKQEESEEHDIFYESIIDLPPEIICIYSEIINTLIAEPVLVFNTISIIDIKNILFSEDSEEFNGLSSMMGTTSLTLEQIEANNRNIEDIAALLSDSNSSSNCNDLYALIHGHGYPLLGSGEPGYFEELVESIRLSLARANSVAEQLLQENSELEGQIRTAGYAGNRSLTDPELNRRVEIIVVRLE